MKPSELSAFLARTIRARLPVLITGAPGIGKSDIVAQAARDAGADLILSHPAVADPTDAKGLPWPGKDGEEATFLPFGELAQAIRATKPTVWFLDDLGQAPPAVQASFMQLLLARRVNGHALPDCVVFIAATNRRIDRAGVTGILEPVKSRFAAIVELATDTEDWHAWAVDHDLAPELIGFIRFREELLSAFEPTADLTNSPMPRTWFHVSEIMKLGLPPALQHEAIKGAVGEGAAVEFTAFLKMYQELPSIDLVLDNPDGPPIPQDMGIRYAIVAALALRTNAKTWPKIARYAERLTEEEAGEFAALLVRDALRKDASIKDTPEFARLAVGDLGDLFLGGSDKGGAGS